MSATPLLQVQGLSKRFEVSAPWLQRVINREPRQWVHAVSDVSLQMVRGETLALVGESGCGKSTLARLLVGLYAPTQVRIAFGGQDLHQVLASGAQEAQALRRRIQMIFQDPYASLNPRWRVHDIVAEPLRVHQPGLSPQDQADQVHALLASVGLNPKDAAKYPHQFSGGQRQRISIARALAVSPEFLVCDEPTSALDVSVQAQVLNLMQDLQTQRGLTYLFISHNLAVVRHVSDRVGVMYLGRVVELAPTQQLFEQPQHPYTRMLLAAIPKMKKGPQTRVPIQGEVPNPLSPPSGCAFHPRCPQATAVCKEQTPVLRSVQGIEIACHHTPG
jgi:peptide/nickel transport system ATP-binding protein